MANKFLPFIVEKSPIDSIYQTMLSRSKGINNFVFLSVFYTVASLGIKKVREYVDRQHEDLTTEQLYILISGNFSNFSISSDDYAALYLLRHELSLKDLTENNEKFAEYTYSDIIGFILVSTYLNKNSDYFSIDYKNYLKNYSDVMKNIPNYLRLSDDSSNIAYFKDIESVKSFVLYKSLIDIEPDKNYCIKLMIKNAYAPTEEVTDDKPF